MPKFHYQARNDKQQIVVGELQAESVAQALAQLEAEGLVIESIGYASTVAPSIRTETAIDSRPPGDLNRANHFNDAAQRAELQRHLTGVIEQSRVLMPALQALAEEMPAGSDRRQLTAVLQVLARGDGADAATALPALPEYWIPLLSAAARSRDPGRVLNVFLTESRHAAELRRQWRQTLAYPLLIAGLAVVVLVALSFVVVPTFRDMFAEFNLRLPHLTVMVVELADWIVTGRILIAVAIVALGGLVLVGLCRGLPASWRAWFGDRFGTPLGRSTALARFAQFCADLLEAGITPASALRIAGHCTRSPRLTRAAWRFAGEIERRERFTTPRFREPLTHAIRQALTGEIPTESQVRLLREIGRCHADRAALRHSWTRGAVEPLAICLVGGIVGTTVFALFMPLISLVSGLSN